GAPRSAGAARSGARLVGAGRLHHGRGGHHDRMTSAVPSPATPRSTAPAGRAAVIAGLGISVPERIVPNHEIAARLDTSDEWIRTRTGIVQRHLADPDTSTSDLAVDAGARALKAAGADDVSVVIVATTTPDRVIPSTAPEVAA